MVCVYFGNLCQRRYHNPGLQLVMALFYGTVYHILRRKARCFQLETITPYESFTPWLPAWLRFYYRGAWDIVNDFKDALSGLWKAFGKAIPVPLTYSTP